MNNSQKFLIFKVIFGDFGACKKSLLRNFDPTPRGRNEVQKLMDTTLSDKIGWRIRKK
jgi:hypothetical protein